MYLFISDKRIRSHKGNISAGDILAVTESVLIIVRYNKKGDLFERMVVDNGKIVWLKVKDVDRLISPDNTLLHH